MSKIFRPLHKETGRLVPDCGDNDEVVRSANGKEQSAASVRLSRRESKFPRSSLDRVCRATGIHDADYFY